MDGRRGLWGGEDEIVYLAALLGMQILVATVDAWEGSDELNEAAGKILDSIEREFPAHSVTWKLPKAALSN